jgi:hypothetical protein
LRQSLDKAEVLSCHDNQVRRVTSDPSPENVRFRVLPISDAGRWKLQNTPIRIGRRDSDQPERTAILCQRFVTLDFSLHGARGVARAFQASHQNNQRRSGSLPFNKECFDARAFLSEPDVTTLRRLERNDKRGNKQKGEDHAAHGRIIYARPGGVTIMRAHE